MKLRTLTMALTLFVVPMSALAEGDAKKGEKVFRKCKACHSVEEGKRKIGPSMYGVIGRTVGTLEGFKFSKAMKEAGAGGMVWTDENLSKYLEKPKSFIPKNKMAFAGLKKESQRADVLAYLKQFSAQ